MVWACHVGGPAPQQVWDHAQATARRGDLGAAEAEVSSYRGTLKANSAWERKFRLLQAEILVIQGLNEKTVSTLESLISSGDLDPDSVIQRDLLLAIAYARLGDTAKADQRISHAEASAAATSSVLAAEVARARGVIEDGRDNFAAAGTAFRSSLQLARQRNDTYMECTALLNLGWNAMLQEHYDESIDWSNRAYAIARQQGFLLVEEKLLGNLGFANYKLGDYEKSLSLFTAALESARKLGAIYDQIVWLNAIGSVYYDTNQPAVAESRYREALELARKSGNRNRTIDAMTNLSGLLVQNDRIEEASQFAEQAISMTRADRDRPSELYPLTVRGMVAAARRDFATAERVFREIASDPQTDVSLKWVVEENLANLYAAQDRPADAERQYRKALLVFGDARASLKYEETRLPFLTNAQRIYGDYIDFLLAQGRSLAALQLADESRARTLAEGLAVDPSQLRRNFNPRELARSLDGTVLFYWLGNKRSHLWAITADQVQAFVLPKEDEIAAELQEYRRALLGPRDPLAAGNPAGIKLYDYLVAPAEKLIRPGSRVIVIADDALHGLNFETLLAPDPKLHYWIEDVTIANASSLRLLDLRRKRNERARKGLLLFGNAISPNSDYPELTNASLELQNVGKHFTPANREVLARKFATPAAYLDSHPERFSFIHFVAHGTSSRLSPLDSAVILSKSTNDEDSFKLYARQIIQRPINAELVTVSTCYGAGTRSYSGEGLIGLTWAFLRAGAHNAVGALWEVSDTATPQLMDDFYGTLQDGASPDTALRAAKLKLLHSGGVYRKPFYWAPFQLYTGS